MTIASAVHGKCQAPRAHGPVIAIVAVAAFVGCHAAPPGAEEPAVAALSPLFADVERALWLGVSNPERGTVGAPHSPDYVADDGAIHVGAMKVPST